MVKSPRVRARAAIGAVALVAAGIGGVSAHQGASTATRTAPPPACVIHNALPDVACTPGATLPVTTKQICVPGYSSKVRNVPSSEKAAVFAEYGIRSHALGQYEVDHLISLELGGSNDLTNLWPEAAAPVPGFHQKDVLEGQLHAEVCSGTTSLAAAQRMIRTDWLAAYKARNP